jgi:hypothetical protein
MVFRASSACIVVTSLKVDALRKQSSVTALQADSPSFPLALASELSLAVSSAWYGPSLRPFSGVVRSFPHRMRLQSWETNERSGQ